MASSRATAGMALGLIIACSCLLPAQDTTQVLPAITVTGARESKSLMAVPLAITRVGSEELARTRGFGLDEALQFVPGVLAQSRSGGMDVRIVIRGFGARGAGDRSNAGTSRGIRVLLDGVPETEPDGRTAFDNVDLGSLAGVEVIRSNASSLWGNAAGGVVSLSTLDPSSPGGTTLEMQAGSFGLRRMVLRTGGRAGAGQVSASLTRTVMDGWRARSGGDRWLATLSAMAPVSARTRLGAFAVASDNAFRIPGPLTRAEAEATPEISNPTYAARDERRHNRLARLALRLEHAIGHDHLLSGMVFAGPKFLQRSERGTFRDFTRYHVGGSVQWRSALALGASRTLTLLAGADEAYQDGAVLFYSLSPGNQRGDTLRNNQREGANNAGVFVQGEVDLDRRLAITLGARYDAISYSAEDFLAPSLGARRTFSQLTPKLGLNWRVSPVRSIYASIGGGVEAPAGNETDPASTFGQDTVTALNPLLDPIRSSTFEVGTRHLLAGPGALQAVSYDVALYHTVVRNEIVPYRGGRFYFTAGRADRSGAEASLAVLARGGFSLRASLTLSRNRYTRYAVDSVHYGVPGAIADYSGNRIVGVPGAIYGFGAGWTKPSGVPLTVRADLHGNSGYWTDDANTVRVAGHVLADVTVGLERFAWLGRRAGVRGFLRINNLFDRRYIASAFLNPDIVGGVPVAFEPGLPRHVVVALAVGRR